VQSREPLASRFKRNVCTRFALDGNEEEYRRPVRLVHEASDIDRPPPQPITTRSKKCVSFKSVFWRSPFSQWPVSAFKPSLTQLPDSGEIQAAGVEAIATNRCEGKTANLGVSHLWKRSKGGAAAHLRTLRLDLAKALGPARNGLIAAYRSQAAMHAPAGKCDAFSGHRLEPKARRTGRCLLLGDITF